MTILLLASPILRADVTVPPNVTMDINSPVSGNLWVDGTANLLTGASVSDSIYVQMNGTLNMYSGTIGMYSFISVSSDSLGMTVFGTELAIDGTPVDYGDVNLPGGGTLTGTYGDGSEINLLIFSNIPINLQPPAPEDPAELILQLIDKVELLNHYQGIVNSLDAKLDAALKALSDLNENNDVAAINTLQAFINAVEAQRDDKITDAQATELIADAQAIIDLLNAQ